MLNAFPNILQFSSTVLAGVLHPAGQIFEKWHFLEDFVNLGERLSLSSMGLAGVLPPAGQSFEK